MRLAEVLPHVNAALNGASVLLLVAGWIAIRRRRYRIHMRLMLAACASSALFLAGYLTRIALTGIHRFPGDGVLRDAYLGILSSHILLAAATLPLVAWTLRLSISRRFEKHRRIARITLPVWMYVSATGVIVYLMLYHLATRPT